MKERGSCHNETNTSLVIYSLSERSHIILYEVLETKGRYLPASLFNAGTLPCITPFINSLSSINVQFYIAVQSLNVRKQKEFQKMNQRVNIGEGY